MDGKSTFLDLSRFELLNLAGKGAFSKVYRVKEISTGEICAAKVLKIEINDQTIESEGIISLLREVKLMSSLDHPSIIEFVGFSLYNFRQKPFPTIITKYASKGSLHDIINLEISGLSPQGWDSTRKLINIYGIASGLAYLHLHDIIHRDMKPDNILMDDNFYPKIADFGLSKITASVSKSMNIQSQSGLKGTPLYMAPEIMRGESYTKAVDVYSFSYIVYEILTGVRPFNNLNFHSLMLKVVLQNSRPDLTDDIPLAFQDLISQCWSDNPEERPSFDEIVYQLKTNKDFITDSINEDEFYDYVDFIDNYKATFTINDSFHYDDIASITAQKVVEQDEEKIDESNKTEQDEGKSDKSKKTKQDEKKAKKKKNENEKASIEGETIISVKFKYLNQIDSFEEVETFLVDDDEFEEEEEEKERDYNDFLIYLSDDGSVVKYAKVFSKNKKQEAICLIINPDSLNGQCNPENQIDPNKLLMEAYLFKKLKNQFVVNFIGLNFYNPNLTFDDYEYYEDDEDEFERTPSPTLFYEFPKNGSLAHLIREHIQLTPLQRQIIIIGIVSGLRYLHSQHFFHGRLSPGTIWLDENFYPKILTMNYSLTENGCSLYYQAPELFEYSTNTLYISESSDVYSLGRLLYFLITGFEPFKYEGDKLKGKGIFYTLEQITRYKALPLFPDSMPDALRELLVRCWREDINDRPSIDEVFYLLIHVKKYYIVQSDEDLQQVNAFIDNNVILEPFNKCSLSIECNKSATIDIGFDENDTGFYQNDIEFYENDTGFYQNDNEFYIKLKKIIRSNFTHYSKKKTLNFLIQMAQKGIFQSNEILLQKVISYVNKYSFKNDELADQFLTIVFGNPIHHISQKQLKYKASLNIAKDVVLIENLKNFDILIRVNIPNSVKKIKSKAFYGCHNLKFVNIPESIKNESIGKNAFENCPKLKFIRTPSELTKIQDGTFKGDESLSNVSLNDGLEIIGKKAFSGCNAIQYLKIPKSVVLIDDYAFDQCKNLKVVIFKGGNPTLGINAINSNVVIIHND
ncbi:hypothetical protein M9Y10_032532 [Tritrichomonas musculus]|uniref:Protein kinase domain-containing protein n=1 Tax=Tritrichomonas musculus TaxID=1915356 RepID=A0ABR2GYQ8_9EUKA